jgi:serine/threonine protein kinase
MKKLTKSDLKKSLSKRLLKSIDHEAIFRNLPYGYWVYNDLLKSLYENGWTRFAPGFKAGVYGSSKSDYCIKILGMGVGNDPLYYCEKGEYIWHERRMMQAFHNQNFHFLPKVLSVDDSIEFLIKECGVNRDQAYLRCKNNDLLVTEYINGIPLATQTGHHLDYLLNIDQFNDAVFIEMGEALVELKKALFIANNANLVHNDPMPPNIIFSLEGDSIAAKLVDFELAQNLNEPSPDFVNKEVEGLYIKRDVPFNSRTNEHKKNLDQHLLDGSIEALKNFPFILSHPKGGMLDGVSLSYSIPFVGGASFNLGVIKRAITKK